MNFYSITESGRMMENEKYLTDRGKPLTEEEIMQLEIDLDLWLPPDYRGFLARCNGGLASEKIHYYPVPIQFTEYCIECGVDPIVLHRELSSHDCEGMKLSEMWKNHYDRNGFPPGVNVFNFFSHKGEDWSLLSFYRDYLPLTGRHYLPIAYTFGDNPIFLCLERPDRSPVYYFDHNIFPHGCRENLLLIADSFTGFFNGLTQYPEDPKDSRGRTASARIRSVQRAAHCGPRGKRCPSMSWKVLSHPSPGPSVRSG